MKRMLSLLLALVMLTGPLFQGVLAAEPAETTGPVETTEPVEATEPEAAPTPGEDIGTGTPDGTPPILKSLTITATGMTAPGSIEVIIDAEDDISGIDSVLVWFMCSELDETLYTSLSRTYYDDELDQRVPYPDGKYHGSIKADQYQESGVFVLDRIQIRDAAGNDMYYFRERYNDSSNYAELPAELKDVQFTVTQTDVADGTPPVLKSLVITTGSMTAPGSIEVIVDAEDDISGIDSVLVWFMCSELDETLYTSLSRTYYDDELDQRVPYPDGKYHGSIKADQYQESGVFVLDRIQIRDAAGNDMYYFREHYNDSSNYAELPAELKDVQFTVRNSDADVITSIGKSDFTGTVENAEHDAYIIADYSGDATMPKAAFEAIAGTNKTIDLISEGITWRFEGSDITEQIKDIGLKVDIHKVEEDPSASADAIEGSLNGDPGVVMRFPENGTLPGKATIQVKVDYAMREYLGSSDKLWVYYYNDQTGELELIAEELTVINDTYVEFSITHCSYYVLTAAPVAEDAAEGSCGSDVFWKFDKTSGTLTISGTGAMTDQSDSGLVPWYGYREQITAVVIEPGVTTIGDWAFESCGQMVSVTIPEGIVRIGECAFWNCNSLKSVAIPASVTSIAEDTFSPCKGLTGIWVAEDAPNHSSDEHGVLFNKDKTVLYKAPDITGAYVIPDGVTVIKDGAFSFRDKMTGITIPDSVHTIGREAFRESGITRLDIPASVTSIGQNAFLCCLALTEIRVDADDPNYSSDASGVLFNKDQTTLIHAPEQTKQYVIPDGVTRIEEAAFAYCAGLTDITICDDVTSIGELAFYSCDSLTSITIPSSVRQIGFDAFGYSQALESITFQGNAPAFSTEVFYQVTAKVYYPSNDSTWTKSVMQDYGGKIDWISYSTGPAPVDGIPVDGANFPDKNFRAWILKQSYGTDAWLTPEELAAVTMLEVGQLGIYDLTGIQHFTALEHLDCSGNQLTFLDLSGNPALRTLYCGNNQLTSLDLSRNPGCTEVYTTGNERQIKLDADNTFDLSSLQGFDVSKASMWGGCKVSNGILTAISSNIVYIYQAGNGNSVVFTLRAENYVPTAVTSGSCGKGVTWTFNESSGLLVISGTGAMDDQGIGTVPWKDHQNDILSVLIQEGVTYVGAYAFYGLPDLTRVSIPLSVTAMGDQAFSDSPVEDSYYPGAPSQWEAIARNNSGPWNSTVQCSKPGADLSYQFDKKSGQLTISGTGPMDNFNNRYPAPWEAYLDAVVSVVIEEGVTTVDAGAFTDLSALKTVEIPTTVTEIPEGIFYGCGQLVSITVAPGNEDYLSEDGILFNKDKTVLLKYPAGKTDPVYSIPDTVTTIGQSSFARSGRLSNVQIPDGVTSIGHWAFENCAGLGSVRIPDSVTQIGPSAFISCTGLREVTVGSGIRDLDICVFANCISLTEVDLPDTLINIWECTFEGCTGLLRIVLPSGMNFISDAAFADCTALEEIVIGGVKEIYFPFANCALKKVVFQSNAPTYCTDAFQTLTLTAYYPAGDPTWTDAVRQSFGGNVTWIPVAYSGVCGDDLTWEYNAGTLTISGTGDMYDYSQDRTDPAPWAFFSGDIKKLVLEEGVAGIGDHAFADCSAIENASFPSTLVRVGEYPFYRFSRPDGNVYYRVFWSEVDQTVRQWSQIRFEADSEAFLGGDCTDFVEHAPIVASGKYGDRVYWELNENGTMEFFGSGDMDEFWATGSWLYDLSARSIVITEGITNIGMNAFETYGEDPLCVSLETVTVASTVKRVEEMAFAGCQALKTITFTGDAPTFGDFCFRDVTATAYYPAGNATWTDALMQDYEGDITWVPYCLEHSFGDWVTEGNTSSRTCTLCGHTEHKVSTESGDVEIQIPQQPDLDVEVDPVLPSEDSYILVEEAFENADDEAQEILKVFDIGLKNKDGVHVQPNGTVKVKLPLDWAKDRSYKVYRVNDDGTLTDMQAYRQGSHMVFETDHFSLYVIAEGPQKYGAAVVTGSGRTEYETLDQALQMASSGDTVQLLKDAQSAVVLVPEDVELDLNGYVLTAGYVASFGDIADRSQDDAGLLKVDKARFLIQRDNCQLPVWDQSGYRFVEVRKFNQKLYDETTKFAFQPVLEAASHGPILRGSEQSGVTILVRVSWKTEQGSRSQDFLYGDRLVSGFIQSYKDTGRYGSMFTLTLSGTEQLTDLTFQIVVRSEAGVELLSEPIVRPDTDGN